MDEIWAVEKLKGFIGMTSLDEVAYGLEAILREAQIVEKILDRATPRWRVGLRPDLAETWQPRRQAAIRALSEIENAAEIADKLGDIAPTMAASAMHVWAWEAARSLWQSGHFGEAVRAATVKVNAELQNKLGRRDIGETRLFQQAFSADLPSAASPRLRPAGDDGGKTALSVRRGIAALAEGCYAGIRNPASHETVGEISEQIALEQLAIVSLLARWIDESTVVAS